MHTRRFALALFAWLSLAGAVVAQTAPASPRYESFLGLKLVPVPEAVAAHLPELKAGQGLLVEQVANDSRAAQIGLKKHDVLIAIGTTAVKDGNDLLDKLSTLQTGERELLQIIRSGKASALSVAHVADHTLAPPKSLFKPGGPPAVSVEMKPLTGGAMEITLFFLSQSNKMQRHVLNGNVDQIERQVNVLAREGRMPENIHDLVALALQRLRTRTPVGPK